MDEHKFAVFGKLNVNLDGISLLLPREPNGGQRVFRRIMRRAAMGDDFHDFLAAKERKERKEIHNARCTAVLRRFRRASGLGIGAVHGERHLASRSGTPRYLE